MKKSIFAVTTLLVAGMAATAIADDAKKTTDVTKTTDVKGENPKALPGWVIIEEYWPYPFLYDFRTALHNAPEHYRAKDAKSASDEIEKAIDWLKYAEDRAEQSAAEDLSTARLDLMDHSASLKIGRHLRSEDPKTDGRRQPVRRSFDEAIAATLRDADRILIFGGGTGESSAMDKLIAGLNHNHCGLNKLIVGSVVIDASHLTEGELLAKAREFFGSWS